MKDQKDSDSFDFTSCYNECKDIIIKDDYISYHYVCKANCSIASY